MAPLSTVAAAGMQAPAYRLDASAQRIAASATAAVPATETRQAPAPSLERDLIDQMAAKHAFVANAKVFQTAERMLGSLLDAIG